MTVCQRATNLLGSKSSFSASSGSVAREFDFHFLEGESIRVLCSYNRVLKEFSHNSSVKGTAEAFCTESPLPDSKSIKLSVA
jgi:hypothetical protein